VACCHARPDPQALLGPFSKGARGKFFKASAAINLPVYLEAEVQAYLADRAKARGIEVAQLVNELLKKNIELIEAAR
jgi:hypothetical protein